MSHTSRYNLRIKTIKNFVLRSALLLVSVIWLKSTAAAQSPQILHQGLDLQSLPSPGTSITLQARLSNSKDTERKMRLLAVRDGRVQNILPLKSFLDEYDQPTYEFEMLSPLGEVSYEFVMSNPDKSISTSPRYSVRRPCIPYIDVSDLELEPKTQGGARLETLIKLSRGLEREVANYETAIKVTEDILERLKH